MRTLTEWTALAQDISFRAQAWIDGEFRPSISGDTFPAINPATEELLVDVASCDTPDIDAAVVAARRVFKAGDWSRAAPAERKRVLLKLADLLEQHADEFALIDTLDMGKTISEMTAIDVPDAIDCLRWTAECIDKVYGEIAPTKPSTLGLITRHPVGVVGAITPWNYPLLMAMWKLAPALAAGNSVVLKPSEKASLSCLRFAELARDAGLPNGVLNVVPGFGHTAGKALALHMDVDALAFTGSTRVAGMLMQYAGQSNLKRVWIEAGGKSPLIVFEDCQNIEAAARGAAGAIFTNQGEVCIAGSRLYVQNSIREPFIEALKRFAGKYQPGNPLDPKVRMGPMVDKAQLDTVNRYVQSAIDEGGRIEHGGLSMPEGKGFFPTPTIITETHQAMTCVREEIFGPVLAVAGFDTEEEAIALANDSIYGLGASVWTDNLSRAHRVAGAIESGMVWVNGWGEGDTTMPFGGVKGSGNGRDKSLHALDKYSELKSVWISL
ncbi:Aldehyde dehydrogenase [Marinobacterium lacunae]|uniref:Aldehyde dehydrogenase n=1 Tax=Marinobacterium lacunae TaxID=1232683 RepID=A0A081FXB0_9GAMM|nr:aldehyde dehydrogenase [Marinobacterium lacunae]KEA63165.1 Aldehyde dehydrogenase [Marinobacterium lacunae]MBR9882671.1 aldehyde dehydrogenase [Oceanospirillales bacterium]